MKRTTSLLRWASLLVFAAQPAANANNIGSGKYIDMSKHEQSSYIVFKGTISSQTFFPKQCCEDNTLQAGCEPVSFGPYNSTSLTVGVNPKLVNSWFFELYHFASDTDVPFSFTYDKVFNLDFASSVLACWSSIGAPCDYFYGERNLVVERTLDLSRAAVKQTEFKGSPGYVVGGDSGQFTKSSNRTYEPGVDVDTDCFFGPAPHASARRDVEWLGFVWAPNTNFTYSLSFSNTTADMSITTYANGSKMELEFSGTRANNESKPIQLNTSNSTLPGFENVDGTRLTVASSTSATTEGTVMPTVTEQETSPATSASTGEAVYVYDSASQSVVWSILGMFLLLLG